MQLKAHNKIRRELYKAQRLGARAGKGFSLIEMVVVIVIVGIVFAIGALIISRGFQAYFTGKDVAHADWQGRIALERMTRELRAIQAANATALTIVPATQITFVDTLGATISYGLSGTSLQRNSQTLADNAAGLTFSYFDRNQSVTANVAQVYYITVAFSINEGVSTTAYRTTVHPRNFP